MKLGALEIICIITIVITMGVNSQIRSFLVFIPAKKSDNLGGKRRVVRVVSGILVFLAVVACGTLGYAIFLDSYPSIIASMIIILIGLVIGVGQVRKLNYLDVASVKTYEWIDSSEQESTEEYSG